MIVRLVGCRDSGGIVIGWQIERRYYESRILGELSRRSSRIGAGVRSDAVRVLMRLLRESDVEIWE
jgi:hypothetical protein